ncbi:MAG: hypothetical protein ACLSAF_11165 [Intestinimonas sp.]
MGKRTWMALALSLALLAGCGYRTMPAQGGARAGGASSAVETARAGRPPCPPRPRRKACAPSAGWWTAARRAP